MSVRDVAGLERLNRVYAQYVKPVEEAHLNEFVLVRPDGQMVFAPTLNELGEITQQLSSPDNCIFKVGPISAVNIL